MATIDYMRIKNIKIYLLVFFGVLWWSCHSGHEDKLTSVDPPPVYFSKNWKAEMGFQFNEENSIRQIIREDNGNLVAYLSLENGLLQSRSKDNGKSWSKPRLIFTYGGRVTPVIVNGALLGVLTTEKVANGGQMYFHTRSGDGWEEPGPMRDTHWGDFHQQNFAADSSGNIYCAWTDFRQGNPDIYLSASIDGGKTWSENVRIDDDQSGQEQQAPVLLSTPEGILYALWEDNRDPDTLFDIYFSSSHNGGRTWSPAVKINDDFTFTWQITPSAVLDNNGILYVAWLDFRDRGAGGEITSNIYFTRSDDGGVSWLPNVRISDAQYGHNHLYPKLQSEHDGSLYVTWMDSEDNQQNDIYFSYSIDGGQSWCRPVRVNDDIERASHYHKAIGWLGFDSEKNGIVGWLDWRSGKPAVYFAQTLDQPDTTRPERDPVVDIITDYDQIISGIFEHIGDTLFYDDFTDGFSSLWEIQSGVWVCIDQTYIGYGAREASNFVGSESWNDYKLKGQFKLDKIAHQAAILYLRVNTEAEDSTRYYRIHNYFRRGVRVEHFNGKSLLPLVDIPYSFHKDQWYSFSAMVHENVLYYSINDNLVLVTDEFTHLSQGKIGIGTEYFPTYFRDILVTTIK